MTTNKFLNGDDDITWVKRVHLNRLRMKAGIPTRFKSFVLWGNEDSPEAIDLYIRKEPNVSDGFVRVSGLNTGRVQVNKVSASADPKDYPAGPIPNPPLKGVRSIGSNMTEAEHGDILVLYSYQTPVAVFVPGLGVLATETKHSSTTSRHISKWLAMHDNRIAKKIPQEAIDAIAASGDASAHRKRNPRGPGKFSSDLDEWVYMLSLEGSVTEREFTLVPNITREELTRAALDNGCDEHDVQKAYQGRHLRGIAQRDGTFSAAIAEADQGFVYVAYYRTDSEMEKAVDAASEVQDDEEEG